MVEAAQLELSVASAHPDRHPCGGTTTFTRFLNAYAMEVESSRSCRLIEADDDLFYEFAHRIGYYLHLHYGVWRMGRDEGLRAARVMTTNPPPLAAKSVTCEY